MGRNEKDESLQRRVEEDQPLKEADEIGERDTMKLPVQPHRMRQGHPRGRIWIGPSTRIDERG